MPRTSQRHTRDAGAREGRQHGGLRTGATIRITIVALVVVLAIVIVSRKPAATPPATGQQATAAAVAAAGVLRVPRLVDVGAERCIPCKAMAPILVELRAQYAGRMQVDFIDVWKNPSAGDPYQVSLIPTQVFFDEQGRELTRHEGFISKDEILATWKRLGYDFTRHGPTSPTR